MLQTTSNVQVVGSQSTDVRRINGHTGELAMMLYLKGAVAPASLGTRVIWRVEGKTGSTLAVQKMVEEDLRAGGSDVCYQFKLFWT